MPAKTSGHLLRIDSNIFDLRTIKETAYRFADKFTVDIKQVGNEYLISILPLHEENFDATSFENHFRQELIDQDLRRVIREETANVRNLILANAFSRSGLIPNE